VFGAAEALQFLGSPEGPQGSLARALRTLDPIFYLGLVGTAFIPAKSLLLTPLQIGGMVNGAIFLSGLTYVWLAFAEPPAPEPEEPVPGGPRRSGASGRAAPADGG
jgi:hypothetical protein